MTAKEIDRNAKVKNLIVSLVRNGDSRAVCRKHFSGFRRRRRGLVRLEAQSQIESARAQTAEQVSSALIQTLVTIRRAGDMAKSKGKSKRDTTARTT